MCFSLAWFEQLLIWLVVVAGVVALLKLLLPIVLPALGVAGATVMQAINIVVWVIVCIFLIWFVFDLISCLIGMGGGFPLLRH